MSRDVGDRIGIRHVVLTPDNVLTAATVTVVVTRPDGTTVSPDPSVTSPSIGVYVATFLADEAGQWTWAWTVSGAIDEVAHGSVDVGSPAPGTYATLDQLRSMPKITTTDRDELLQVALAASAAGIDSMTGRRRGGFYLGPLTARQYEVAARTVRTRSGDCKLLVDEIGAPGWTVEIGDGTTWTALPDVPRADPLNALADGQPVTGLVSRTGFGTDLARVTARPGWPSLPDQVVQASLILALRLYGRKDSPTGIAGDGQMGVVRLARNDPDVMAQIGQFILPGIA